MRSVRRPKVVRLQEGQIVAELKKLAPKLFALEEIKLLDEEEILAILQENITTEKTEVEVTNAGNLMVRIDLNKKDINAFLYFIIFKHLRKHNDAYADYFLLCASKVDIDKDNPRNPRFYYYQLLEEKKFALENVNFSRDLYGQYAELQRITDIGTIINGLLNIKTAIASSRSSKSSRARLNFIEKGNSKLSHIIKAELSWILLCNYAKDFCSKDKKLQKLLNYLKQSYKSQYLKPEQFKEASIELSDDSLKILLSFLNIAEDAYKEAIAQTEVTENDYPTIVSDSLIDRTTGAFVIYYSDSIKDDPNYKFKAFYLLKSLEEANGEVLYDFYQNYDEYTSEEFKALFVEDEKRYELYLKFCDKSRGYFLNAALVQYDMNARIIYSIQTESDEKSLVQQLLWPENEVVVRDFLKLGNSTKEDRYLLACKIFDSLAQVKKNKKLRKFTELSEEVIRQCDEAGIKAAKIKMLDILLLKGVSLDYLEKILEILDFPDLPKQDAVGIFDKLDKFLAKKDVCKFLSKNTIEKLLQLELKPKTQFNLALHIIEFTSNISEEEKIKLYQDAIILLQKSANHNYEKAQIKLISLFLEGKYDANISDIRSFSAWYKRAKINGAKIAQRIYEIGQESDNEDLKQEYKDEFLKYTEGLTAEELEVLKGNCPKWFIKKLPEIEESTTDDDDVTNETPLEISKNERRTQEMLEFLKSFPRKINSKEDLPSFILTPLQNGEEFYLKGSILNESSSRAPNDIDIEFHIEGISKWSDDKIKELIKGRLDLEGEIDIYRRGNSFGINFKGYGGYVDISFYDPLVSTKGELSWVTNIDAKRMKFDHKNGAVKIDYVEDFKRYCQDNKLDKSQSLIINPRSRFLVHRLCLLQTFGETKVEDVCKEIKRVGIDCDFLFMAELKLNHNGIPAFLFQDRPDSENIKNYKANIKGNIFHFMKSHNLDLDLQKTFVHNLKQILGDKIPEDISCPKNNRFALISQSIDELEEYLSNSVPCHSPKPQEVEAAKNQKDHQTFSNP